MRLIFHLAEEDETAVAKYIEKILKKVKAKSGLAEEMSESLIFEEMLFLRIAYEYTKMYKVDRNADYLEYLDKLSLSFEDYSHIFNALLTTEDNNDRLLILSEWLKFSLSLPVEDEVTRRNLVSLMFEYIGHIENSYRDYQHLLKY